MTALQQILMSAVKGPIQFVGGATSLKVGATAGNSTMPLNSGLTGGISSSAQSGDFVIAVFITGSTVDRTLSITDGTTAYTLLGTELYGNSTADVNIRVAYKFITSDTTVTFGPTGATTDQGAMAVYVFRNVNVANPLDVAVQTNVNNASRNANPPAITPVTAGSYIVCVGGSVTATAANGPYSVPSDLIGFFTTSNPTASTTNWAAILGIGHKADWVSGAFDAAAFISQAADSATTSCGALSIALRPA